MKNLFLTMAVVSIIGFVGCDKEKLSDIEKEVTTLQDSLNLAINQHNALLDSISTLIETINDKDNVDINALKIAQISSLFESMARQPEISNTLISATEMLYFDYTELLPFSDKTIEYRGIVIGSLFDAIARQPQLSDELLAAAIKFLGEFNSSTMSSDFVEGKARGIAIYSLFEGIARQPEAYDDFDSTATKLLGEYNSTYFSDELVDVSKAYAIAGLNEGLARQPEAASYFNSVCIKYLNFNFIP